MANFHDQIISDLNAMLKNILPLFYNVYHNITTLEIAEMVQNINNEIFQERTWLFHEKEKKFFNLASKTTFLEFSLAEVTFDTHKHIGNISLGRFFEVLTKKRKNNENEYT